MGLKIALYQMDVAWCDKKTNLERAAQYISSADADLVVLPETFTTGFKTTSAAFAETMDGPTVEWFRQTATSSGRAIIGSTMISDTDSEGTERFFNRLFFAKPDGKLSFYDKRHLFSFGGEGRYFSRGARRIVVEYKGFRILPLICYDLRFPVWSRRRNDYDVMICIASWDNSRIGVWDTLLRARAIENQSYVIGVNRVGKEPGCNYEGHSVALNYYGEVLAYVEDEKEDDVIVELELEPLRRFREKFRAWEDADNFDIVI